MSETTLKAMAIGCHPDDIEFMMAGTMFLLKEKNVELHYMNVANGSCGTQEFSTEEIVALRREEAKSAASCLDASWYPSIIPDAEVTYDIGLVRKVAAVIREVAPTILLIPSLYDYMEDHMYTARIAVTAAFTKGMPNFETDPAMPIISGEIALYHALPYGLRDAYNKVVIPDFITDISEVVDAKTEMLSMHKTQRNWLDSSQKLDSYLQTMQDMCAEIGRMAGASRFAEGWIRHNPLGFSNPAFEPLKEILSENIRTVS
jgi:LmbE family N-acetylglucosaminyl deacetylase